MAKLLKISGLIIIGALSVMLLVVAAIFILVDPNDFRDDITVAVQEATGRELIIEGELGLSVYPWLGLSLGETRLSNAAGFAEKDFARVAAVDINVKLLPLLQQRLEMKALNLRGLHVNLSRAKDGRSNWDDLLAAEKETETPSAEKKVDPQATSSATTPALALAIGGINIEDAQLLWDDQQAGQRIEIKPLLLRTGPISLGEPVDIQLRTNVKLSEPAMQTPIEFDGRISADLQALRFTLHDMKLALNVTSPMLPVSPMNIGLTGNVDADLAQQHVQVKGLQFRTLGLSSAADLSIEQLQTAPQIKGQLAIAQFSLRDLLKTLAIDLPEMADANALTKVSAKLNVNAATDTASVSHLMVRLDDSTLMGAVQVKQFTQPAIGFDLTLDAIDVDRYLPPTSETPPAAPPPAPAGAVAGAAQLPIDMLRSLDMNGKLRLGKLKAANAHVADIVVGLKAKRGLLQATPLQASLYQGQYSGQVALDVRKKIPKISANEKLTGVHIGPLLKDVLDDDKVSGVANVAAKVTAQGITPEAVTKTLNGTANFSFKDGAVKGLNIGQMIREAYAKIKGKPKPPKATNQTDFAAMSGSVKINNGVVNNQDLKASSPALRVAGKGSVDLPKQRINYLLNASIVETDQGQGGKELDELKSVSIPVKITGTFDKPKFKLDLGRVLKAKAKAKLDKEKQRLKQEAKAKVDAKKAEAKKKLEEKKDKAKKELEEKLKDKLKGLFR